MIKHLITGGCSFSAGDYYSCWTSHIIKKLLYHNPNLTAKNTGYQSQGQDLIQKKVSLSVLEALEAGFKPEDILVIVMWSGTSRKAWYIDNAEIIQEITKGWRNFQGGFSNQFLDLKNQLPSNLNMFFTKNLTKFNYNPQGGWYFTVDGSDCHLSFVRDYYLLDEHTHGPGKVHTSVENMIMLQTFCKLHGVKLVHQFFMDRTLQDIVKYKDLQMIKYLYNELDLDMAITKGMFEYLHQFLPVEADKIDNLTHDERKKIDNGRTIFDPDGFHPGDEGDKLWVENILYPFLLKRKLINE